MSGSGTLLLASVPSGAPEAASPRLAGALATAPVVAVADAALPGRLAGALGVRLAGRVVDLSGGTTGPAEVVAALRAGQDVLVLAGGVPGACHRLVAAAVAAGAAVTALAGPSAVTTALVLSGLPCDRFCVEDALPAPGAGPAAGLAAEARTMVFPVPPGRLAATLAAASALFGADRRAALCPHDARDRDEVRRGTLADLAVVADVGDMADVGDGADVGDVADQVADVAAGGGGVLVVAGAPHRPAAVAVGPGGLAAEVARLEGEGRDRRAAIAEVARAVGVPRRSVYDAVIKYKTGRPAT